MRALFEAHPRIAERAPHVPLCDLPTPVARLRAASERLGTEIWVKRDDISATSFGGNKPRKLEFLLGEARRRGARAVVTFGYVGSNHATATAVHASGIGIKAVALLLHQPPAAYVRRNLLIHAASGTDLHAYRSMRTIGPGAVAQLIAWAARTRRRPMMIPAGGSSPLGVVGMVNAGFELAAQVRAGEMPEPDVVYVACGSAGSAAGLSVGMAAAGLRTSVVAVRVAAERWAGPERVAELARDAVGLLRGWDAGFPSATGSRAEVRGDFYGPGYAHFTPEGDEATELVREAEGYDLDGTYTAKAFAAVLADARAGELEGRRVLFWLTATSTAPRTGPSADVPRPLARYLA